MSAKLWKWIALGLGAFLIWKNWAKIKDMLPTSTAVNIPTGSSQSANTLSE